MNTDELYDLIHVSANLDAARDADVAFLATLCAAMDAIETLAYIDDCRQRHVEPSPDRLLHFISVDYSESLPSAPPD